MDVTRGSKRESANLRPGRDGPCARYKAFLLENKEGRAAVKEKMLKARVDDRSQAAKDLREETKKFKARNKVKKEAELLQKQKDEKKKEQEKKAEKKKKEQEKKAATKKGEKVKPAKADSTKRKKSESGKEESKAAKKRRLQKESLATLFT